MKMKALFLLYFREKKFFLFYIRGYSGSLQRVHRIEHNFSPGCIV